MKQIKEILKENSKAIALYITTGLIIAFLTNYKAIFFQKVVDKFTDHTLNVATILLYGGILMTFYLVNYVEEYPAKKLEHGIYLGFKLAALKKISKIDYLEYQNLGTGALTQRIENGADAGKKIIFDFWLCVIRQLVPTIVFSIWFIYRIDVRIAYIIAIGYVGVFLVTNALLKMLYKLKEKILCDEEELNHHLVRGFMEMVVFRVSRRFTTEINKSSKLKEEIIGVKVRMNMIHEAFFTAFALIVALLNVCVLLFAWLNQAVTVGEVVALISLIENAYTPIAIFNVLYVQYKLDKETFQRFDQFLSMKEDGQLDAGETNLSIQGKIDITDLTFYYDKRQVFRNINVAIKPGEKVALVGSSGSGKTTLVELLLGLLKYESGSIKIDGHELKGIALNELYKNISYISQEAPIFDGTIKENLVYDAFYDEKKIEKVLQKVMLSDTVDKMEEGIKTRIGERGMTLSGGERQRLALARLWFQTNHIVLLDEATSALDNITEEKVMKEVMQLLKHNTVIAIAHRLSSIKEFDRIIVFEKGRIVEQGTFNELLKKDGYFTKLYNRSKTNN